MVEILPEKSFLPRTRKMVGKVLCQNEENV